jgi:hypothetical protein
MKDKRNLSVVVYMLLCVASAIAWGATGEQSATPTADPRNALIVEIVSTPSGLTTFKYNGKELSRDVLLAKLKRLKDVDKEGRLWIRLRLDAHDQRSALETVASLKAIGFQTVAVEPRTADGGQKE